jgi:type VI secretion system protein VasD
MTDRAGLGLAAGFVLLNLAGCGGPPPPPPAVLTLNIAGSAKQNPNAAGQGTAVAIRLYQLSSTGKFQSTDVYTLMGSEAAALGSDEAAPAAQYLLAPGQRLTETVPLKPMVSAIGLAVLFQNINQSTWKLTAPVAPSGPSVLTLRINGLTATIAAPAAGGS